MADNLKITIKPGPETIKENGLSILSSVPIMLTVGGLEGEAIVTCTYISQPLEQDVIRMINVLDTSERFHVSLENTSDLPEALDKLINESILFSGPFESLLNVEIEFIFSQKDYKKVIKNWNSNA